MQLVRVCHVLPLRYDLRGDLPVAELRPVPFLRLVCLPREPLSHHTHPVGEEGVGQSVKQYRMKEGKW